MLWDLNSALPDSRFPTPALFLFQFALYNLAIVLFLTFHDYFVLVVSQIEPVYFSRWVKPITFTIRTDMFGLS